MFAVPENTIVPASGADASLRHPVRTALQYAANRDRWRGLLRYDPAERFAVPLERDHEQEVWLLSWLPGQLAEPHDHGHTTGAFTVVCGRLTETVYHADHADPVARVHLLSAGQSRVFGPGYVHRVSNEGPDPVISVHVYRAGGRIVRPATWLGTPVPGGT
ncbi:putative metal-dependent enzyme (double-stranded beta helix superfamily) [Saccharomonospora amisosensis]|uniref:Putative metal-dependent enzyme (Double-stranded beta helix superfamily) n=1 Tax=Saccharomonospora amisosensis TaxID=1128677 RepID=A0A7X5ZSK1_9PSEU|nr:cysteine dioxygenase family protein [Saccharomonospora amisosensis]NIJ13646.1 putative metal-dependent enzyme (double-stranded beta helix superfamily) [Saccharomonospora amisosensis]